MFKTIFGKQLFLYICIISISFFTLGTSLSQIYKSYFIDRQEKALIEQGGRISKLILSNVRINRTGSQIIYIDSVSYERIKEEARILSEYLDSNFIFTDADFNIEISDTAEGKLNVSSLPEIQKVLDGEIVTLEGTLGGMYSETKLTVAYPIVTTRTVGVIFMSSSMNSLKENISEVVRMTTLCVMLSGSIAFVLIYISSRSMSKPLQEMNEAAKVIASGDFEKRIEVNSIDEVGQLAESFNNMARSLDEQEKTRREFIANISHDLRSPLTSIIGFLQAIKDGTIPHERQERYITIILDECIRLSKLANDLLDISKFQVIDDIEVFKEDFDINELIRNIIIQFEHKAKSKDIALSISFANDKDMVRADYDKIKRVFYNLLDNAFKFTPDGGSIKVETSVKDKKVYVSVKDNGLGIKEEDKNRIFERFYKADSSRGKDKSGSGLGLAIVREFIRAHNEKIMVNSEEGKGSEFIFTLSEAEEIKGK